MDQVIANMLVIIVIGLLADKILFSPRGTFSSSTLGNRKNLSAKSALTPTMSMLALQW